MLQEGRDTLRMTAAARTDAGVHTAGQAGTPAAALRNVMSPCLHVMQSAMLHASPPKPLIAQHTAEVPCLQQTQACMLQVRAKLMGSLAVQTIPIAGVRSHSACFRPALVTSVAPVLHCGMSRWCPCYSPMTMFLS